ncbi:hypothetical protein [Macrococcus capreoli]|uniref:hypothetical protein n=1 Tax=Macrococcus capreoli TaxID=2982690 RepID=UPI003EE5ECCB
MEDKIICIRNSIIKNEEEISNIENNNRVVEDLLEHTYLLNYKVQETFNHLMGIFNDDDIKNQLFSNINDFNQHKNRLLTKSEETIENNNSLKIKITNEIDELYVELTRLMN